MSKRFCSTCAAVRPAEDSSSCAVSFAQRSGSWLHLLLTPNSLLHCAAAPSSLNSVGRADAHERPANSLLLSLPPCPVAHKEAASRVGQAILSGTRYPTPFVPMHLFQSSYGVSHPFRLLCPIHSAPLMHVRNLDPSWRAASLHDLKDVHG